MGEPENQDLDLISRLEGFIADLKSTKDEKEREELRTKISRLESRQNETDGKVKSLLERLAGGFMSDDDDKPLFGGLLSGGKKEDSD